MFFTISLYVALAIFGLGLVYKISTWFRYNIGIAAGEISTSTRISAAVKGIFLTILSGKIFTLLRVFILGVVLQVRVLREDFLRWLMHICLYVGFMLLLLMHALDNFVTSVLFPEYYSTINPFMFLRDFFGLLVLIGIAVALYRRFILKVPRLQVLEVYWVQKFGVVSPNVKGPFDAETLELGKEAHEMTCVECHSRPHSAFLGYATAKIITPIALGLDGAKLPTILWYIHFLACWLGLAYLPFSKMFHIVASPLSLLANAVMDRGTSHPANIATRQVMELDACTHCCTCSVNCSVGVAFETIPNLNILPSEKIASVKTLAAGKDLSAQQLRHIQEGIYLCTNCRRCTVVCPVGINLQDLWFNVRETLLKRDYPEFLTLSPLSYYRGLMRKELVDDNYPAPLARARDAIAAECDLMTASEKPLALTPTDREFKSGLGLSDQASTFSDCFGCETCTTVCPVVANFESPQEALGLLPHQIMHSCGLGLKDLAFGSSMLWDCLTCYQCQEQCPQGVCVTDVLYELKNRVIKQVKEQITK